MANGDPYEQGHFDALCGFYAIINGLTSLNIPNMDKPGARKIFKKMVLTIAEKFPGVMIDGLTMTDMKKIMETAVEAANIIYGAEIVWFRPPSGSFVRINDWLSHLENEMSVGNTVAIVGLNNPVAHWTVAITTTDRTLTFYDSGWYHPRRRINKRSLTLGDTVKNKMNVDADATFFLRKMN